MAPVQCNGLLISRPGLDSGEGHAGRHAHSVPGRDATPNLRSCTEVFPLMMVLMSLTFYSIRQVVSSTLMGLVNAVFYGPKLRQSLLRALCLEVV